MRDIQSVHEENVPQITDTIDIDFELLPKKRAKTVKYISEAICAITASFVMAIGILLSVEFEALVGPLSHAVEDCCLRDFVFPRRPRDNTRA